MFPNTILRLLACCCIAQLLLITACRKNSAILSPTGLVYTPDTAILLKGTPDTSVTPVINWNGRKGSFSFAATPPQGITIDNLTGKISWTASLPIGTYLLPVVAHNDATTSDTVIYMVTVSGKITTIAGSTKGFSGDGGPALNAQFNGPSDVTVDAQGNIYIADTYNSRIRVIGTDSAIHTFSGDGNFGLAGDGRPAAQAEYSGPFAIMADSQGDLYVTDYGNSRIRKINAQGIISTVAGAGSYNTVPDSLGDGGPATQARLYLLGGKVAPDLQGSLYIGDYGDQRVRKVTPDGIIHTIAGNGTGYGIPDGTAALNAAIGTPNGLYYGAGGNIYIVSEIGSEIYRLNSGNIYTVAGSSTYWGTFGTSGDGGPALKGLLNRPTNMVADNQGNLFIADFANNKIREIDTKGIITTVAGNGQAGLSGDNGPAAAAELNGPYGLTVDANGDLYIADTFNHRIRKVSLH